MDAYRADEIDLEVLKAFAVTTGIERQVAGRRSRAMATRPTAWQVKRMLTEERIPAAAA